LDHNSSIPPEEVVLACVESGDTAAWEEFVRRFQPLIATVALRTARQWGPADRDLIDDLVQETYLKLCADSCRLLRQFESQHPGAIFGFLKVVTTNVVHDHFKIARAAKRGAGGVVEQFDSLREEAAMAPVCDPKAAIEHEILVKQVDQFLTASLDSEECARSKRIFWLYYRMGLTAPEIAALPGIKLTTKGVESTVYRLGRLVRSLIGQSKVGKKLGCST